MHADSRVVGAAWCARWAWWLWVSVGFGLSVAACMAQTQSPPPDGDLYFRRTHPGQVRPADQWDTAFDHTTETTDTTAAPLEPMVQPAGVPSASGLVRDHGVDPANLGKGDWIWRMDAAMAAVGVSTVQGLIDYLKARKLQWITVKCGDGGTIWNQFNTDLIQRAHAAGLKIFAWAYVYGANVQGEINVALNALSLGADGFIIDAEGEYERLPNNAAVAEQYCQAIRAAYPNRFLAHAPFPIISYHRAFPYVTFGKYCDAVMPQAYWYAIGVSPTYMVEWLNREWRTWHSSLVGADTNAIKPLAPIGQGWDALAPGEITAFVQALKTNTPAASPGGYNGVSFWSCQHHTPAMWEEITAVTIGRVPELWPAVVRQPLNRSVEPGANVVFSLLATGAPPLFYQWQFNGYAVPGGTNPSLSLVNVQPAQAGLYTAVVTNAYGAATSAPARLVVNLPRLWQQVWADDFETNSAAAWDLFWGAANGIPDFTARFAFNYATNRYVANGQSNFIPPAPSSAPGATRGLKLTVNKNDAIAALAAVSLYPKGLVLTGNYALRCDVWLNYNGPAGGGPGSTEFATFGLNHTGTRVNWASGNAEGSDGVWFAMCGEGGATSDYRAYVGTGSTGPIQLPFAESGLDANGAQSDSADDPFFRSLFPAPAYETAGAPGKHWVQCELSQLDGVLTWRLNGVVVAQRTNTSPFTAGTVMLGYMDLFQSIPPEPDETFVIFDNVQVSVVPTPPVITQRPLPRTVNAGSTVSFSVQATGTAPLAYQWRRNGVNLPGATNSTLILPQVRLEQAGIYTVVVTNLAGSVTSLPALLTVVEVRFSSFRRTADHTAVAAVFTGAPAAGYLIDTSTNLLHWSLWATVTNHSGECYLTLPISTNLPQQFFRVRAPD
jgi:hypothetical protein